MMPWSSNCVSTFIFFFNDTATTEIYTLSLHDALPIFRCCGWAKWTWRLLAACRRAFARSEFSQVSKRRARSEEHTSELQSRRDLVCRLLLEKKNKSFDAVRPAEEVFSYVHPCPVIA